MHRIALGILATLLLAPPTFGAVFAVGNFTEKPIEFTVKEADRPVQTLTIPAFQVLPVTVAGPCELSAPGPRGQRAYLIDPYNAYGFLPDPAGGVFLEGVNLPGEALERDRKPEANFAPPERLKIPVTLLLDDSDQRVDALWQAEVKERFLEAAALIEAACSVRLELAGFARWKVDPQANDIELMLSDFEDKVAVKPGGIVIGWSHRVLPGEKPDVPFGIARGAPYQHIVIRDARLGDKNERTEVLAHFLATELGAVPINDPGSVMRPTLGDGKARLRNFTLRLDPLNVLAMNIWVDELRRGSLNSPAEASIVTQLRLVRVYKALVKASTGNSLALGYINDFDKAVAANPAAKKDPAVVEPKEMVPAKNPDADAAKQVLKSVMLRARLNTGPARLTGDDLTAAYIRAAANEAMMLPEKDRAAGFLMGLAVALDDSGELIADPHTAPLARAIESAAERAERIAVLGNPTLRGRRDLRRKFVIGLAATEAQALPEGEAADGAVARFLADLDTPAGAGFPGLSADLAGAAFARAVRNDLGWIVRVRDKFTADEFLPATSGLRDGLPLQRFREDYGSASDPHFRQNVDALRSNVKKLAIYGK